MSHYIRIIFTALIFILSRQFSIAGVEETPKSHLEGVVIDKSDHKPLAGAVISFPDIKVGTITDMDGRYHISDLPAVSLLIEVNYIGYQTIAEKIDLSRTNHLDFELVNSPIEVSEVVVTGSAVSSDIRRTSVSIVSIKRRDIELQPSSNLINYLITVPGISAITTGGAISKPVIRGLGYNHVVTLHDGIRQEGNQWGDEHGIEIDQFSADRIEILKGPASLLYGSDALGGVINILEPEPEHVRHIDSQFASYYSTNNHMTSNSAMVEGSLGGMEWKLRGTYKSAGSFQTPSEYVYNSGFSEHNLTGMIGISRKWGYSHLHFSVYDSKIGVIEGERDSLGRFVDSNGKLVPTPILSGRSLQLPFQRVTHETIHWINNIFIRGRDQLKVNIGFQTNDRREFSEWANVPNLFFHLGTLTYEARYSWAERNGWEPVAGVSGMTQFNRNRGSEFLIPDYDLQDWGTFFYLKKSSERFTFNGGIRADNRLVDINQLLDSGNPSDTIFHSLDRNISAISGALGMTWHMSNNVDLKTNLGRGFRAPNIAELSANGVHEGTFRYEKGSSALLPETSLQLDAELSVHTRSTSITLSTFCNSINNYIYSRNLNDETKLVNGVNYPVYRYVQGNSLLTGFEFFADIHPLDNIHFENGFSYVYGQNEQTHVPLPFIPAAHSHHMLRFEFPSGSKTWKNPYVSASADLVASQNRIDAFETRTPGYALLGLSAGSEVQFSNKFSGKLFISISNLANHSYVDHLNRLKYIGIQNPGRDISFGVILRFEGKVKESDAAN